MSDLPLAACAAATPAAAYRFTTDWTSSQAALWQALIFDELNPFEGEKFVLEIGSHEGRSAREWVRNIHNLGLLVCVDPWQDQDAAERFRHNMRVVREETGWRGLLNGITGTMRTLASNRVAGEDYDLIYIDGDHAGHAIMEDWCLCLPLMKPGTLVLFDDYKWFNHTSPWGKGALPKVGIDSILELWADKLDILHTGYQVLVKWKGRP